MTNIQELRQGLIELERCKTRMGDGVYVSSNYFRGVQDSLVNALPALLDEVERLKDLLRRVMESGDPVHEFGTTLCNEINAACEKIMKGEP